MRAKILFLFSIHRMGNNEGKFASPCPYVKRTLRKRIAQIGVIENAFLVSYLSRVLL